MKLKQELYFYNFEPSTNKVYTVEGLELSLAVLLRYIILTTTLPNW